MIVDIDINKALDFSIQQIFAESYWGDYIREKQSYGSNPTLEQLTELKEIAKRVLQKGNSPFDPSRVVNGEIVYQGGYAKLTSTMATEAANRYEIVDYQENQAAGFSAILLKDTSNGQYTLAFRSTEYMVDYVRDAVGADLEIKNNGYAYGQISEMEAYYQSIKHLIPLKPSSTEHQDINISGYSLGGHLASTFYLMHSEIVNHVYTQNSAGVGRIGNDTRSLTYYKTQLLAANEKFTNIKNDFFSGIFSSGLTSSEMLILKANLMNIFNNIEHISTLNYSQGIRLTNTTIYTNEVLAVAQKVIDIANNYKTINNYAEYFQYAAVAEQNHIPYMSGTHVGYSIYDDLRYKFAIAITKQEFNSSSLPIDWVFTGSLDKPSTWDSGTLWRSATGGDGGQTSNTLFDPEKFTVVSGKGSETTAFLPNDPNFVSKSNIHADYYDLFIEDQPELIGNGGKLPGPFKVLEFVEPLTRYNDGDLGNTHSITSIIDSLRAIKTIQKLHPTLTDKQAESLLNSVSNEYAKHIVADYNDNNATESHSISNLINSLYRLFINPNKEDTKFSRKANALGEIDKRNEVHTQENELMSLSSSFNIVLLYDRSRPTNQQITSATNILNKAKQNDAEGMAYRYALREMNSFVVLGKDYSVNNINGELDLSKHSDLWYKAKAEILVENISNNIKNNDAYYSSLYTYGKINDDISFRKINYLQTPQRGFLGINIQSHIQFRSVTIFAKDTPQTIPISGPPVSEYYEDTKYNDYIFMGNKNNNLILKGGTDTIETGNNNNFINASNAVNSTLNLSLYGNNTVMLGSGSKGGTLYYKNQLLTGGNIQSNGTYQDQTYTNISYEFIYSSTLKIKYLNPDNTFNITEISGFNRTLNQLGLTFNDNEQATSSPTLIDLTDNIGNPYVNSAFTTLTPPSGTLLNLSGINYDTVMISGSYAYFYKEGGTSYKAFVSDLPLFVDKLAPQSYDLAVGSSNAVYYRPVDTLLINKNFNSFGFSVGRSGDDLLINALISNALPTGGTVSTIKNYFKFDHSSGTGIYFRDATGTALSQLTQAELLNYDIFSGDAGNNDINGGVHSTIYGGLGGNDKITSGTQNTTFLTYTGGGSDELISGSGNNRFVFSGATLIDTYSVIKNIKSTDKIIFVPIYKMSDLVSTPVSSVSSATDFFFNGFQTKKLEMEGRDLIITLNTPVLSSSIRVENYFDVFTNSFIHSGIYLEDSFGESYEIDISDFETKRTTTLKLDQSVENNLTVAAASQIKEIDTTDAKATIKAEKDDVLIKTSGGTYADIELKAIPTTAHTGSALNVIQTAIGTPATGEDKDTNITVKNFSGGRDQLNVAVANTSNVIFNKVGNDLIVSQLNLGETLSMVTLTDYFINNYNPSNPTSSSGISVYNGTSTTPMTVGALGGLLADYAINSSSNNAVITVGDLNRNTVITSTGTGATITGGKFNDNITAGNGDDVFMMSRGVDTYHLSSTSGIDELRFDKEKLFEGAAIIVQFDSSIALEDVSFHYDKYEELFTIFIDGNNGLVISNIDENSAYSIEQFMQVKLSNGDNIFEENYTIENGGPLTYDGLPNNIILGTSANNSNMNAITSKNNLVFGGAGTDSLRGSNNVIATGNTDYKANLLVGGLGNDTIAAGSYDVVMARQGDGQDVINYTTNHDDFLISLIRNAGSTEFGLKTVGNNLEIYYGNGTTDKVTINSYWTKTRDEMTLVLTDRDSLNNTHLRGYGIAEIMSEVGLTKANSASSINYIDYSDVEDILLVDDTQNLIGGEVANYYAELGTFTGLSLSTVVNTLKEFDQEILLGKSGYGDISDYRKL